MPRVLRDLLRQRLRTLLTIVGVGLGMFTLVALGALGEHFRAMVEEAKGYTRGQLRLYTKTNAKGINPGITPEIVAQVEALAEVRAIGPSLVLFLDGFDLEDDPLSILLPLPLVEGLPAAQAEVLRSHGVQLLRGRWLAAGDERRALVVDWLAERRGLVVGGQVTIRHNAYEVVGVFHAPDAPMIPAAIVPYELLNADLTEPELERTRGFLKTLAQNPLLGAFLRPDLDPELLDRLAAGFAHEQASMFRIYEIVPRDRSPEGTRALAAQLRQLFPDLAVIDPDRIEERMESALGLMIVITLIVTVLATVVGGLLIINTMAMAVIERRKEIAIRAAIGATPGQIAREFVLEAATLAGLGAALGIGLGAVAITISEPLLLAQVETGAELFKLTPRLLAFTGAYALVLGALAGGLPALRAARIDPAVTLREL